MTRGGHVLSFVPAQHILDGIHDGHIAVFVAIAVKLLLILSDCFGFDDRVVAFAVVVPSARTGIERWLEAAELSRSPPWACNQTTEMPEDNKASRSQPLRR